MIMKYLAFLYPRILTSYKQRKYLASPEVYKIWLFISEYVDKQFIPQVWEADLHRCPATNKMVLCGKNKGCHKNIFNVVLGHQSKCSSDNPPLIHWCREIKQPFHQEKSKYPIHQIINDTLLPWKANIPTIMMKSPWQQPILPFQRRLHLIKCCKTVADTFMIIAQQQRQKNHIKRGILKV